MRVQNIWLWRYKIYAGLFFVFVLATAPASLLTVIVQNAMPTIWLADAKGSFWQGQSSQAVVTVDGGSVVLGELHWSINAFSLLWLSPTVQIQTEAPGQTLIATATAYPNGNVSLQAVKGEFPLTVIEPWVPVLLSGQVFFDFSNIALTDQTIEALQGTINLRQITWLGGDVPMTLGNYHAGIAMETDAINIKLQDQDAQLGLTGSISAMLDGQYQMDLNLSEKPGLNPAVIKSLTWLGKKQGGGVVIRREGEWQ